MAGPENKTFYEVLDVRRDAKAADITAAYKRLLAGMRRDDAPPDPKRLAMAKVAHETLAHPGRRTASGTTPMESSYSARRKRPVLGLAALAFVAIGGGSAYYFLVHRPATPVAAAKPRTSTSELAPEEVVRQVLPLLGRVEVALMSGEVRQAGTAVALGEGEMAIPCKGVPPGAHLTVKLGEIRAKAELGRSRPEIDVCVITARSAPTGTKLRTGIPPATEKLHAVVFDSNGAAIARSVTAAHAVDDANGPRMALRTAGAPLPDGTPLFDHQARLVGFVSGAPGETTPSAIGAGRIAALRPSLRGAPASTTALAKADPQGATSVAPTSSPSPANAPSRAPAASGAGLGTLMDEGFTTLWREDEDLQLSEVLDNAKKGYIGLPLAYWTRWQGRDPERPMVVGCRITLNGDIPVYQYEQAALLHEPDGYFYCALAPTMMDLNLLTKGEYTFEIFVNGRPVAERSIQVERRIMTPTAWMVITLLAGFGVLAFLRRNKVATHPG